MSCSRVQGIEPSLIGGSTDANLPLSRGYPALAMGVTTGGSAHTLGKYVDVAPVAKGMGALTEFAGKVFGIQ